METQKIANLLNDTDDESSKFATRKLYVINDQNNGEYGEGSENDSSFRLETNVIKSSLCDYSDAYILVTGSIPATCGDTNTKVAFKNCAPFIRCLIHINDQRIDTAKNLDILMNMYNLFKYSDNYAWSSASLFQFKRDEPNMNNAGNPDNVNTNLLNTNQIFLKH